MTANIFLLAQSLPWENVVYVNKIQHSFSADTYNIKYVYICLNTPVVVQLLDFSYSCSFYVLFCDICRRAQYPGHFVVKASVFLCIYSPWTRLPGSLWWKSCGTIHLYTVSEFESWSEGSWGQHSLPTCSSGKWFAFLICRKLQLFFKVNFKNYIYFLKSSKRHSHSMRQGLKFRVL